jgi:hypothetical protein
MRASSVGGKIGLWRKNRTLREKRVEFELMGSVKRAGKGLEGERWSVDLDLGEPAGSEKQTYAWVAMWQGTEDGI